MNTRTPPRTPSSLTAVVPPTDLSTLFSFYPADWYQNIQRVPIGSQLAAAVALTYIIFICTRTDSKEDWVRLLTFSFRAFGLPPKGKSVPKQSAVTVINANLRDLMDGDRRDNVEPEVTKARLANPVEVFRKILNGKLQDGDISGQSEYYPLKTQWLRPLLKLSKHCVQNILFFVKW